MPRKDIEACAYIRNAGEPDFDPLRQSATRLDAGELRLGRAVVKSSTTEATMARGALLWLLGVPIPIILLLWLFWH